jgi:hypothetical protein
VRAMVFWDSWEAYWAFTVLSSAVNSLVVSSDWASFLSNTVSLFSNLSVVVWSGFVFLISAITLWSSFISLVYVTAKFSIFFCTSLFVEFTAEVISAMLSVVTSSRTYNFVSKPAVVSSRQLVIPCNTPSI